MSKRAVRERITDPSDSSVECCRSCCEWRPKFRGPQCAMCAAGCKTLAEYRAHLTKIQQAKGLKEGWIYYRIKELTG